MAYDFQNNPFLGLGYNAFQSASQPFDPTYLNNVSNSLYDQANYNYQTNLLPTLNSNAIRAGGYGGSRAALAQGVVMDRLGQNVTNAMAPMYAQGYENSLNRGLQAGQAAASTGLGLEQNALGQYQADTQRQLGLGNLGVNQYTADTQRQLGLGNLGLGQYQADTQRQLGLGGLGISGYNAETARQLGLGNNYNDYMRNLIGAAGGGTAASGVPNYTNPWLSGIGGGLSLAQILGLF